MVVVRSHMIHHATATAVGVGAAEVFRADHLTRGGFHQRRTAKEDRPLPAHDDRLVAHGRHVGAAGGAGTHDAGDLGNPRSAHPRLIVEDAAEMLAVREHLGLMRQVRATAVDEVDARQVVLKGDLLSAKVLLDGDRKVAPPFTVASLAMISTSRPDTRPTPVIRPAPGASPSCIPKAASWPISRKGEPISSSRSTRWRGSSLPRATCRARVDSGPPKAAAVTRSRNSAAKPRLSERFP